MNENKIKQAVELIEKIANNKGSVYCQGLAKQALAILKPCQTCDDGKIKVDGFPEMKCPDCKSQEPAEETQNPDPEPTHPYPVEEWYAPDINIFACLDEHLFIDGENCGRCVMAKICKSKSQEPDHIVHAWDGKSQDDSLCGEGGAIAMEEKQVNCNKCKAILIAGHIPGDREKVETSEFVKECREYPNWDYVNRGCDFMGDEDYPTFITGKLMEACTLLEAVEKDNEALGQRYEALERHYNKALETGKQLQINLKRYGDHETGCMKGDACNCGFKQALSKAPRPS